MGRWKESEKFPHTCAVSRDEEHIGFGQFSHDMNRFIAAHNADCDAHEAKIAELEAEAVTATQHIDTLADRCEFQAEQINDLVSERDAARDELARVKAESLRVVEVAGADYCVWCDGSGSWLESEYESGGVCVGQVENTCIHCLGYRKPVRLERWETEE